LNGSELELNGFSQRGGVTHEMEQKGSGGLQLLQFPQTYQAARTDFRDCDHTSM
jgi:hypothetical protein